MQKHIKKRLNGSKDINLKNQAISAIFPKFAPIFRGGGVEIEKKFESTFQELFKYEIRFSKSLAVVLDIGF